MIEMLRLMPRVVDAFCPPSSKIGKTTMNWLDGFTTQQQASTNRQNLLTEFPNSPKAPKFVDSQLMHEMIAEAKTLSPFEFYCNTKNNGKWDLKRLGDGKEYKDFGNYMFGIVAKANQWDDLTRNIAVGTVAWIRGTGDFDTLFTEALGDSLRDHKNIKLGAIDYLLLSDRLEERSSRDLYRNQLCRPEDEGTGE